ncbi:MAG: porin family protein [Candidatus Symbiothrix sp.]|jgi:opacity protein-like surface antigen|nr:porin family protein [Candidatus Symbiothrix sp.]
MKLASKHILIWSTVFAICTTAVAQEYRYEFGGAAGAAFYLGDANENAYFRTMQPAGGLIFRSNLNFHWAIKADLLVGKVSGDTKNEKNVFPNHAQIAFSRTFFDLGGQMEFNFLPYSDKYKYLNTSKLSPYLLVGLGLTLAPGNDRTFFGINLPLGVGIKYKLSNKLNLGIEYTIHRLFGDAFDAPDSQGFNLNNPYKVNQGLFKNKDWYNTLLFSITWEFGLRDGRCTTD